MTRLLRLGALALSLASCARAGGAGSGDHGTAPLHAPYDLATPAAPPPTADAKEGRTTMNAGLTLELTLSKNKLTMKERRALQVGFVISNGGAAPVDPAPHASVLTVSGTRAYAWDLAVQNGARDASWTSLSPGKRLAVAWPLGEALFERPGHYRLVLRLGEMESSADVDVRR